MVAQLQGGKYWTLFTPEIWKVLHAVLQPCRATSGDLLGSIAIDE
jgi:hypothetical protein